MKAVFLDKKTFSDAIDLTSISKQVIQLTCFDVTPAIEIIKRCIDAEIIITNKVVLNAATLANLPKLKLICITATGFNNVDIEAAQKLGIAVTNVSGYSNASVSQYVFAQLLDYFQQISHHNNNTLQGYWSTADAFCFHGKGFSELAGKTIGIIGYGNLGQAVARIAQAFEMKVLISERINSTVIRSGRVAFDEVIKQADVISLHCPQTADTEQLINRAALAKMKQNTVLINTARGALIDESALLDALKNKTIAYAVLDVLNQEPPSADHPLLTAIANKQLTNLKITAHIAWASDESQQRLISLVGDNISAFKQGEKLNRLDG
jgi:glycerate dehydrogenase